MFWRYSYTIIRERINLCLLIDCFINCNISKHKLMRSLMMV